MINTSQPDIDHITYQSHTKNKISISQPNNSTLYTHTNWFKKKQNQKSFIHQLKQSNTNNIINDDTYNSMIQQWRQISSAPIVNLIQINNLNQITTSTQCANSYLPLKPQPIKCPISNINNYTTDDLLLILKSMLDGHQAIYKKLKATSVSLEKTLISTNGLVKVWVNQHLERNQISGEVLTEVTDIVKKILSVVGVLAKNNQQYQQFQEFIRYVSQSMKKRCQYKFSYLRALVRSYQDWRSIKMAKYQRKNKKQNKNNNVEASKPTSNAIQKQRKFPINKIIKINQNKPSHISSSLILPLNLKKQYKTSLLSNYSRASSSNSVSLQKFRRQPKSINPNIQTSKIKVTNSLTGFPHPKQPTKNIIGQRQKTTSNIIQPTTLSLSLPSKTITKTKIPSNKLLTTSSSKLQSILLSSHKINQLSMTQQLNIKINRNNLQTVENSNKNSFISTNNQTSILGQLYNEITHVKDHTIQITNNNKQNITNNQYQLASNPNQKNDPYIRTPVHQQKPMTPQTNSHTANVFHRKQLQSRNITQTEIQSQNETERQKSSYQSHSITKQPSLDKTSPSKQLIMTPIKSPRTLPTPAPQNPFHPSNHFNPSPQLQSIYKTENSSSLSSHHHQLDNPQKITIEIDDRIAKMLNLEQGLAISTYMHNESGNKNMMELIPEGELKLQLIDKFGRFIGMSSIPE